MKKILMITIQKYMKKYIPTPRILKILDIIYASLKEGREKIIHRI
jgi:hypothetical protein